MKGRKKIGNRVFSVLLAMIMVFSMMPTAVFGAEGAGAANDAVVDATASDAAQFSDMPDNWSTNALQNAVTNGLLSGSDGKIMPNQNLTRAQMAAVITRAFGAVDKGDLSEFADVKSSDWFSDSLAKAYQMEVIKGANGTMSPNSAITRQEVFVILARAFKLQPAETISKTFSDANQIASWAKGEVYAFVNAGYIQGTNGKLNPKNMISRAEFAQIFDNIIKQYINTAGEYTQVAAGNVMINVPGVTLKNLKITGDLIVGDGVGDGEVTLDSVEVTGRMVIRGGGENSIIIRGNSNVSHVVVARVDGVVSVKVQGDADVEVIYIDDGSDDVNVEGIFGNIDIAAPDIVVNAIGATITNLNVAGAGSKIVVDGASKISSVTIQASNTQISGTGTVTKVEAQAGATGAKIETPNTQISVGAGVSGVTGGGNTQIQPGSTVNNNQTGSGTTPATAPPPSGGGGNGSHTTPTVNATAISITDATTVTFTSDVAGATIKWNGNALSSKTVVGSNTVTVPLMESEVNNILVIEKSGYITFTKDNLIYTAPYDKTATLGEWVKDRTEPENWEVSDNAITIETKTEPANNWYAWQGKNSATNIGLTSNWMMETDLVLTDEMVGRDGIRASIWLQVEGSENFGKVNQSGVIDWAILQFKKDSATDVAGWQAWNSEGEGAWVDLDPSIPKIAGTYKLTIIYDEGTIYQYIDGVLVNDYPINVDEGVSAPTHVIIQSYSFGASYSVTWKVPTVKYLEQYPADAKFVSTAAELKAAIDAAEDNDKIYITDGDYALTEQLNIAKPVTIIGLGEVTIKPAPATTWSTENGHKHLLAIYAGAAENPITLDNITFDSDSKAYGLNTYNNAYGKLKDVTLTNSTGAGLTVNGSTIVAEDLNTSGNSWGGVNVDPGSGVSTPSIFTITGSGALQELKQIWADSDNVIGTTVTVEATGYSQYQYKKGASDIQFLWAKDLKAARIGDMVYPSIQEAINAAVEGVDTVLIEEGTYDLTAALNINKAITVAGNSKEGTILKGSSDISTTVNLSSGAAIENLTVTRDNSGAWSTNKNDSLVAFGQSLTADTTLDNCIITQGRNGVYLNNSNGAGNKAIITNNTIEDNRTGINFTSNCSGTVITGNEITDNWTLGIVYYNNSAGTALNTIKLENNEITGNWYGQILLKTPGVMDAPSLLTTGNLKIANNDFGGTYTGGIQTITFATTYSASHEEPGYAAQKPSHITEGTPDGTGERPSWTPPTIRIYKQPNAGITGSGILLEEYADGDVGSVNVSTEAQLKTALAEAAFTNIILTADISVTEMLEVSRAVSIDGGGHKLTVTTDLGDENDSKHALDIFADDVTIKDLTIDSNSLAFGVQAYEANNASLDNVSLKNSNGAGLTVNGSSVTANDLDTSGNDWGGVNVDPGDGVTASSVFTLTGRGTLGETVQIWSDGKYVIGSATVTVNAQGYTRNDIDGTTKSFWTKIEFQAVTGITGVPESGTAGTEVDLTTAIVAPADATNKMIEWTVKEAGGTGVSTGDIEAGKFTPTAAGSLVLTATIRNGETAVADYTQDFTITIAE